MKTKTIELYEFDELPAAIQAKVLDNERDINVDDDFWCKYLLEEWEQKLEEKGFNNPKISYSGFWSQGDGASFVCESIDIVKFLKSQHVDGFTDLLEGMESGATEVNAKVYRIDHHYSHEYTVSVELEVLPSFVLGEKCDPESQYKQGNILQGYIKSVVRSLSKQIYRDLESEYDGLTSDEAVKDTILANEYTFTITGKMENL